MPEVSIAGQALHGRRIVIARPREQAASVATSIRALGGEAVVAPAIAIVEPLSWAPLDAALARIDSFAWLVVTSAHGARAVCDRARVLGVTDRLTGLRLAAVGPSSAAALAPIAATSSAGRVLVGSEYQAQTLAEEIPDVAGQRILFPRGDRAREVLPERLVARGAMVDDPVVYRTVAGAGLPHIVAEIAADRCDALVLSSPSAVEFVAAALSERGLTLAQRAHPALFCIGPVTADALRQLGAEPRGVATGDVQHLIDIMSRWFANGVTN